MQGLWIKHCSARSDTATHLGEIARRLCDRSSSKFHKDGLNLAFPALVHINRHQKSFVEHEKQYEDFETVQQLKLFLKRALDAESDEWVSADEWAAKTAENTKLFGEFLESMKESGGSEERARALWPFGEFGSPQ